MSWEPLKTPAAWWGHCPEPRSPGTALGGSQAPLMKAPGGGGKVGVQSAWIQVGGAPAEVTLWTEAGLGPGTNLWRAVGPDVSRGRESTC